MLKELFLMSLASFRRTLSVFKKIFVVIVVFAAVASLFGYFIQQNKIPSQQILIDHQRSKIFDEIERLSKNETPVGKAQHVVYKTWMCTMVGEACTDNPADGDVNFQNSFFGGISNLMATPYLNPPASGIAWIHDSLRQTGFVPDTYAATGIGFASIQSYMPIWKLFRDVAYIIIVFIMLAIGFMIMFRVNIGGQAAVGIENALPRIVVAMIMITFSFPIAGFLIDIMYALITVSVGLLYDVGISAHASSNLIQGSPTSKEYLNDYLMADFGELWPDGGGSFFSVGTALWRLFPTIVQQTFHGLFLVPIMGTLAQTIWQVPENFVKSFNGIGILGFDLGNLPNLISQVGVMVTLGILLIWGPGIIFGAIILLTIMVFIFRIFFLLLESYIKIILYTVFAPIILMFSALPGNGSIGWWLKNLFGELMTFPTVIIIMLAGNAILAANIGDPDWPFPFGYWGSWDLETPFRLPFLYGMSADDLNTVIALGLVLMIPDFIKMVKGWIGVTESPFKMGIGTFFTGAGSFTTGLGLGSQIQGFKHSALGYDPNKGWLDTLAPGLANRLKSRGGGGGGG